MTGSFNHRFENMPPNDDEDLLERLPTTIPNMQAAFSATAVYAGGHEECTLQEVRRKLDEDDPRNNALVSQAFKIPLETGAVLLGARRLNAIQPSHNLHAVSLAKPTSDPNISLAHTLYISSSKGRQFGLGSIRQKLPHGPSKAPGLDPQDLALTYTPYNLGGVFSGPSDKPTIVHATIGTHEPSHFADWPDTFTTDIEWEYFEEYGPVGAVYCQIKEDTAILKGLGGAAGVELNF